MSKARDIQREEWREVPGLPGISASSFGRVQLPETVGDRRI
jgi:hypothetical protein